MTLDGAVDYEGGGKLPLTSPATCANERAEAGRGRLISRGAAGVP
jgi:hypothetical protein